MKILDSEILSAWLAEIRFEERSIEQLKKAAEKIKTDENLQEVFRRFYSDEILSGRWEDSIELQKPDEAVAAAFGREWSLFYLLCYLHHLSRTKEEYQKRGIPFAVYCETLSEISTWFLYWEKLNGYPCFCNFGWIWRSLSAKLFRLGRLQYHLIPYAGDFRVFQNKKTGATVAFNLGGLFINARGDVVGAGGVQNESPVFVSRYEENEDAVKGTPCTPYGKVLEKPAELLKTEWDCVLQKNQPVLDIHIPRGEKITTETCRNSILGARRFYRDYFEIYDDLPLVCHSWLLSPQLQQMLEPTSNIVRFQREFYLLPHAGDSSFMWSFVFDEKTTPETAPQDTHLRKVFLQYLRDKKPVFDVKGFCLKPDQLWGTQGYMKSFDDGRWEKGVYQKGD